MEHILYNSIEEMIRPETLSRLENKAFTATRLAPFQGMGWSASGSTFLAVHTTNGKAENGPRYIVKRVSREWDWLMHATGDRCGRTTALWQYGIFDRLPDEVGHAVVACAEDGTGRAILMRDMEETLLPGGEPISKEKNKLILDGMAALHAAFWEDPILHDPTLNLCALEQVLNWGLPERARQIRKVCSHEVLDRIIEGWNFVPEYVGADSMKLLRSLIRNPNPLYTALARFPKTLVHNDLRLANLGIVYGESPRLLLLDWMFAAVTVPARDLARYLFASPRELFIPVETSIHFYKQRLAQRLGDRFDESWWQPQLELSLLANFLQEAGLKARCARYSENEQKRVREQGFLTWFSEHALKWARWLA